VKLRHLLLAATLLALPAPLHAQEDGLTVLTGLAPIQALAAQITQGTSVTALPLTARPAGMPTLLSMLARPDPAREENVAGAEAVIDIAGIWPADPTYPSVRAANIWTVEIDATQPLDGEAPAIARLAPARSNPDWRDVAVAPATATASHPWLATTTAINMAEIITRDLKRMAPDDAATLDANLAALRTDLRRLKAEFETRFAGLPNFSVYALTDQFVYLTSELGLYVDGYFLEQDVRWTAEDYAGLTEHLRARGITTVIHQWEPAAEIVAAIEAAGARLVVLSTGETLRDAGPGAYEALMRSNFEALYTALSAS
jgi:ABC-type Zn uptake system ZnuABC Zn-binding protein ZnuA